MVRVVAKVRVRVRVLRQRAERCAIRHTMHTWLTFMSVMVTFLFNQVLIRISGLPACAMHTMHTWLNFMSVMVTFLFDQVLIRM